MKPELKSKKSSRYSKVDRISRGQVKWNRNPKKTTNPFTMKRNRTRLLS
jgi:hypothetical protein